MRKWTMPLSLFLCLFLVVGCKQKEPNPPTPSSTSYRGISLVDEEKDFNNPGKFELDQNEILELNRNDNNNFDRNRLDPMDQSETPEDLNITQKIRKAIMSEDKLSTDAKNIKIITINRVVTLRGEVPNRDEKDLIVKKVKAVIEVKKVNDELQVASKSKY